MRCACSAIIGLRKSLGEQSLEEYPEIHSFLDGFYLSRIGIRILIGQHISLHDPPREDYIGAINTKCDPHMLAEHAIDDARSICLREYGSAPDVIIYCDKSLRFPYIPAHLHHMLFELVKNSLRAVSDRFEDADDLPPAIRVVICQGDEDITIKVRALLPDNRHQLEMNASKIYLIQIELNQNKPLEGDNIGMIIQSPDRMT